MAKKTSPVGKAVIATKPIKKTGGTQPPPAADPDRQTKIHKALYQIADAASAVTHMQSFYKQVHKIVGELMYAENFVILLYDAAANLRSFPYYADSAGDVAPPPGPPQPGSLLAEVLAHPHTLHYTKRQNEEAIRKGQMFGTPSEDFVGIPLVVEDQAIGGIIVQSYVRGIGYSDEDIRLLEFVAQHIAIALTRARAIDETRQRNVELAVINSVQEGLASKLDMQSIYDLVGDKIRDVFDAQGVTILTYDPVANLLNFRYSIQEGERIAYEPVILSDKGLVSHIVRTRRTLRLDDVEVQGDAYGILKLKPANAPTTARSDMPKSWLGVPLIVESEVRGVIDLYNIDRTNAYSDSDVRLLETLANSMSVALENARLFEQVQQKNTEITEALDQQTATSGILRVIAESPTNIQPVLDAVAEYGARLSESVECAIFQVVPGGQMKLAAQAGPDRVYPIGSLFPLNHDSVAGSSILDRTIYHIPDILETGERFQLSKSIQTAYRSFLGVPLMREDQCIGIIFVRRPEVGSFSEKQINLVKTFADQAAIAIENVRLFDETKQRNAELAIINSVQEGLASKLDYHAIVDLVGDTIRDIFRTQSLSIGRYDHANQMVDYSYVVQNGQRTYYEPMAFSGVAHHLIRTRQMLVVGENVKQKMDEIGSHWGDLEIPKTLIYVPLIAGETVTGVVAIYDYVREHAFSDSDIRLLQTLSNAMSVALENARLWEQEKMFRKALQRELEIGREIQAGFLPEALPIAEGWEIAASLISAREVAGDFYDAFELPDGNIGLVIADVCDKGVGAALFMTLFRSLIRVIANQEYFEQAENIGGEHSITERLKHTMNLTNNYIAETHEKSGMFSTLFFGILNPRSGRLAYINGGHEPPLIIQAGGVRETLGKTGPAVGAMAYSNFETRETQLQSGDIFFAFTDGVPDCLDPRGEFFGRERMLDVFQRNNSSAHAMIENLETELNRHVNGATRFDDITLVAVRRG